jgi:hypothetical protein
MPELEEYSLSIAEIISRLHSIIEAVEGKKSLDEDQLDEVKRHALAALGHVDQMRQTYERD